MRSVIHFQVAGLLFLTSNINNVPGRHEEAVENRVGIEITPDQCKNKILRTSPKDTECFKIDLAKACNMYCLKLGRRRCGRTNGGEAIHYQCKNKQSGPKKTCCCEFQCKSPDISKKEQKMQFRNNKKEIGCLCSIFTHSEKELEQGLSG